jgi:hypothetical protein
MAGKNGGKMAGKNGGKMAEIGKIFAVILAAWSLIGLAGM